MKRVVRKIIAVDSDVGKEVWVRVCGEKKKEGARTILNKTRPCSFFHVGDELRQQSMVIKAIKRRDDKKGGG